jgi:hypothetical protein
MAVKSFITLAPESGTREVSGRRWQGTNPIKPFHGLSEIYQSPIFDQKMNKINRRYIFFKTAAL